MAKYTIVILSHTQDRRWSNVTNPVFSNMKKDFAMGAWASLKAFNPKDSYKMIYIDKNKREHIFQYHNKPGLT